MSRFATSTSLVPQAIQLFQAGQSQPAAELLQKVLNAQPRNFDALHILGVIQAMRGQRDEAIELFRKALAINKNHSHLQFNMAKVLSESGRDGEAVVHHKWATRLAPDHAQAWLNYGHSLLNLEQHPEALAAFEKATTIDPGYAAAWSNLGLAHNKMGNSAAAIKAIQHALDLQPDLAEAHNNLGIALNELQRGDEALASYERALELKPDYAEAWCNKGVKLAELNRHTQALGCYERALELKPNYVQAWNFKAASLVALAQLGDAMACYERAITIDPDYAVTQTSLGQLLLQIGDFSRGWEKLEARWRIKHEAPQYLQTRRPVWDGTRSNRALLLWGEQGIGDQILYGSILPELAAFPQRKLVALDRRLIPLFARSMPDLEFVDPEQLSDRLGFEEHLPLGSLPRYFRPDRESFAHARHPFLLADPARIAELRTQVARPGKLVCGVSWSSNRKVLGKDKSISLEQLVLPLASDRLHFVDLQYGDTANERQALESQHGIQVQKVEEVDNFSDIDGLAALIQACDVVVSTSNSTVHLAGALGKETLLLLPSGKSKIWYWAEFDGRNLWYPTVRSFTQSVPGQWEQPLAQLRQYLENKTLK